MEPDPVCGMTVDPERSATRVEHSGKTFYFCCAGCANKFRAEPERYLNTRAPVGLNHDAALVQLGGVQSAAGMLSAERAGAASVAVRTPCCVPCRRYSPRQLQPPFPRRRAGQHRSYHLPPRGAGEIGTTPSRSWCRASGAAGARTCSFCSMPSVARREPILIARYATVP